MAKATTVVLLRLLGALALAIAAGPAEAQPACNQGGWPTNDPCTCDVPWQSGNGPVCPRGAICGRPAGACTVLPSCNTGGWPTNDPCLCDVPWQSQVPGNACASGQVCSRPAGTCAGSASAPPAPTPTPTPPPTPTPTFAGDLTAQPKFGGWAWTAPDPYAIVRAGFQWFEIGYPDTYQPWQYQVLVNGGVRPFAYVNMAEVPNGDGWLQQQIDGVIGYSWTWLGSLGQNGSWSTTIIDVRQPDWQKWLLARVEQAYARGARGVKWDVANMEGLPVYKTDATAQRQAVDAMGSVLQQVRSRHPDMKQILNQGYAIAFAYPWLVDGIEDENMIQDAAWSADPGMNLWFSEQQAKWTNLHDWYGIPIILAEYADPTTGYAAYLASIIEGWGLTPYVTLSSWNVQGRGLGIAPPW